MSNTAKNLPFNLNCNGLNYPIINILTERRLVLIDICVSCTDCFNLAILAQVYLEYMVCG